MHVKGEDLLEILVFEHIPNPRLLKSQILVFGKIPNPRLWNDPKSSSLEQSQILVFGTIPNPRLWNNPKSSSLEQSQILVFGTIPNPRLWKDPKCFLVLVLLAEPLQLVCKVCENFCGLSARRDVYLSTAAAIAAACRKTEEEHFAANCDLCRRSKEDHGGHKLLLLKIFKWTLSS